MQNEQEYSSLIYEYFLMKFRFQYYKFGDYLPSIDILCREFMVADQTIKAALRRLRDEGYISMHNGRNTRVIFQQSKEDQIKYTNRFFAKRQEAFIDLIRSLEYISIPLLVEGFRRMDDSDLEFLTILAKRAAPTDLLRFYFHTYQKLDNSLVINLFWETSMFEGFPFLDVDGKEEIFDISCVSGRLTAIVGCAKTKEWKRLGSMIQFFQREIVQTALDYMERQIKPVPKEERISFTWRIYRDRPQLCYSLMVRILYEIYMGEFQKERFLPSYEMMAKKYDVSVSTMRRTVALLNQLGIVQTINGKGTRICPNEGSGRQPDFSNPAVRRNLALFFQSFEIIVYSCEGVVRSTLEALNEDERQQLAGQLQNYVRTGRCSLSLWSLLICVVKRGSFHGIREIYYKIFGLFLWGYPLKKLKSDCRDFDLSVLRLTEDLIRYLRNNELGRCAEVFHAFMEEELPILERHLLGLGFQPEELRTSLSIRLLLSADQ